MGNRIFAEIRVQRDTSANWAAANPVLADGEPGYDTTLKKMKIGDGVTAWNDLDFWDVDAADGADGTTWNTGSGVPSDALGVDGDLYLNTSNGDVYQKAAGVYAVVANITGPKGDKGDTGDAGPVGDIGPPGEVNFQVIEHLADNTVSRTVTALSVLWIGSVEPDNMEDGDIWLDTSDDPAGNYLSDHLVDITPHEDYIYTRSEIDALLTALSGTLSPQGFRAYRAANQTLLANTITTIVCDTEERDEGADYNPATGEWTAPETRWFLVGGAVRFVTLTDGDLYRVVLYVNGAAHSYLGNHFTGDPNSPVIGGTAPMFLAAGDVVTLRAQRESAGDIGGGTSLTYFTGVRI